MKVTMMLGDVVRVADGKLDVLGGGWSVLRNPQAPTAIALLIEVPWAQTGETHKVELVLMNHERALVMGPNGQPLGHITGEFRSDRAPGVLLGGPTSIPFPLQVPPLPLEYGGRYVWVLSVDGRSNPEWELPFTVAPSPPGLAQAS